MIIIDASKKSTTLARRFDISIKEDVRWCLEGVALASRQTCNQKWGISCNDTTGWLVQAARSIRIFILGQILIIRGTCEKFDDIIENVHWWWGCGREKSSWAFKVLRWRWLDGKLEESCKRDRNLYILALPSSDTKKTIRPSFLSIPLVM